MTLRPAVLVPGLLLLLALVAAVVLGLPLPSTDDLFFYGAPLQIAEGGGLTNPPLRGFLQGLGTDAYFCHVPLHPWALGLWLKMWGVSTASILGFAWATGALGAVSLSVWLRRLGWDLPERLLLLLVYVTLHFAAGSRPDGLALSLALAGGAALSFRSPLRCFLGLLLLGGGVLAYPMAALWGLCFAGLIWLATPAAERLTWRMLLLCASGAALLCGALFWWLLDGRVAEWLQVFQTVRGLRSRPPGLILQMIGEFLRSPRKEALLVPVLLCYPLALLLAWRMRAQLPRLTLPTVLVALATALGCGLLYFAAAALQTSIFCGFLAAGAIVTATRSRLGLAALTGIYLVAFSLWWTQSLLRQEPAEQERSAARAAAERAENAGRPLRIDAATARYAFDFRLPKSAYDLFYSTAEPPYSPLFATRSQRSETWIVARSWIRYLNQPPASILDYPRVTLRGRPVDTLPLHPYEIVVYEKSLP
ncbi:MAG: hypothetical protein JSR82_12235 [Verrucomicrobia bacterium]|nr:hypothetical protein [Verrucomicrobiota bacterium]